MATGNSSRRLLGMTLCLCLGLCLAGCSHVDWLIPKTEEFNSLTGYIETMQLLSTGDPATKAEVFQQAQLAARNDPTSFNRLRLALAYAAPAHPSADPQKAKKLLVELRARPEQLTEAERQLVDAQLAQVEQIIWLTRENNSLKSGVAQNQRQTTELGNVIDELQKELNSTNSKLNDAKSKLDAISNLERSTILGNGQPEGGTGPAGK